MLDDDPESAARWLLEYGDWRAAGDLSRAFDRLALASVADCEICGADHLVAIARAMRALGAPISEEQSARLEEALERAPALGPLRRTARHAVPSPGGGEAEAARPQRPVPLRQRQEVQAVLPAGRRAGREALIPSPPWIDAMPGLDNVVTRDYITGMKTAGVRELKARLSSFLRDVAAGEVVLVTDRGRVVAELRPPGATEQGASPADLRYRKLVDRGLLRPAAAPGSLDWASQPRLRLRRGTSRELLDAEREE
jgi:antitoxin (DNA-binding transcriptional repressor) of toxin-antitoxin stability system